MSAEKNQALPERAAFEAWAVQQWGAEAHRHTSATSGEWDAWQAARALPAPAAPVAQPKPRGFLLHWPAPGGTRRVVWSDVDTAGVAIGCPVEPVYSFGVRKEGGAE